MPRKIEIRSPAPATSIIPVVETRIRPTNSPRRSTAAGSRQPSRIVSRAADEEEDVQQQAEAVGAQAAVEGLLAVAPEDGPTS